MTLKPFVLANLWHGFGGQDTIAFDATPIVNRQSGSAIEFGGGLSASAGKWADVYAKVIYTTGIDGVSLELAERQVWFSFDLVRLRGARLIVSWFAV